MNYVIINEQHEILPEQQKILDSYGYDKIVKVPASGWTYGKMIDFMYTLNDNDVTIFVSPIPALMKILTREDFYWMVFHNDKRDKKELPNGRIIQTIAKTGWRLV